MAKMGRHAKVIDKEQFEKLCELQCNIEEVCSFFDVTDKTLNGWCVRTYGTTFSEVFKVKRGRGKIALRRYQWNLAKKNATMAIWLGKQYLGQRDHQTVEVKTDNDEKYSEEIAKRIAERQSVANADVLSCNGGTEDRLHETERDS